MAIFLNNWKRIAFNKTIILFSLLIPVIFIVTSFSGMGQQKATVGIVDHDRTELTRHMVQKIKNEATVVTVTEENQRDQLINGHADQILVFEKGFTDSMLEGNPTQIKSMYINGSNVTAGLSAFLSGYLQDLQLMSVQTRNHTGAFYQALDHYDRNPFDLNVQSVDDDGEQKDRTLRSLGFVIYGCLFMMAGISSKLIVEDKEQSIFTRLFTTPLTLGSYNLQHIATYFLLANIAVAGLLAFLKIGLHADLGPSLFNIYLILVLFSVVSIALGVALSAVVSSTRQANSLSLLLTLPLAMLGGCFWPLQVMPPVMQNFADFTPTAWGMKALTKLVYGNGLNDVIMETAILLAFAVVFFLLASWKRMNTAN